MPRIKKTAQKGKHAASSSHQPEIEEDNEILDQFVEEEEMMDQPIQPGATIGVQRMAGQKHMETTKLEPGVINSSILTRSMSQSRAPRNLPGGTYLTSMPARGALKPTWYKKLFCQDVSIIGSLRKEKEECWEMAWRQVRMDHRLEWLTR
ncbi:hypothetical protein RHSIM_Rhsim03G0106900 [Rhododendron simsii]|uniref:Uncharacterized protein n=1 Tax=Rhododendron simsii TaxID=118357 RepID=A0A834H787_RHOSS|nr:hypothetical protein RHSIM_Rhsim03G0106900 [Rhododendron simsii]